MLSEDTPWQFVMMPLVEAQPTLSACSIAPPKSHKLMVPGICICMYVCMHVCMHAWMYGCMCVCMHVCMYVGMYVCEYMPQYMVANISQQPKKVLVALATLDVQGTTRCDSVPTLEDSHSFPSQTSLAGKANFSKNCCICVLLGIKALIIKINAEMAFNCQFSLWEDSFGAKLGFQRQ